MTTTSKTPASSTGSSFVSKYLTGIFLIIGLIVLSVFWGFSNKATSLIKAQMQYQGQAFFEEVILIRKWAANHGGVYVKLKPDMEINPYLLKVPGLKVLIVDQDGERYTLKNPALITRELSELAASKGLFKFKITSLKPLNPANSPDPFERKALTQFEQGGTVYTEYEQKGDEILYRYMAPLITEKDCLRCHALQGYREGDIRGGISVTITATAMQQQLRENTILLVISAFGIVGLIFAIIRFISQAFIKDLKSAETKLIDMANHDFLTGLVNRREMFNRAAIELSRARRHGKPLSVILIDIDYFKRLNDNYGHDMGDSVLKDLSRTLKETLREYDIVCRYGGEEFVVVTPETDLDMARELAERLRCAALELAITHKNEATPIHISISAGVAELMVDESIEKTISRADAALYRAKESGRNRVEVA